MPDFIRVDREFNMRWIVLILDRRNDADFFTSLKANFDDKTLYDYIIKHRPELAGGYVFSCRLDVYRMSLEVSFTRGGLREVPLGSSAPKVALRQDAPHSDDVLNEIPWDSDDVIIVNSAG